MTAAAYAQEQPYVSAKKLFYAGAVASAAPQAGPKKGRGAVKVPAAYSMAGLRYAVIQQVEPGREAGVDPAREFHSGDRVRFEFESNLDGYLYVIQQGSSGTWRVLFPDARINGGTNRVQKGTPYSVPAGSRYFVFNEVPGNEKLMVFLCKSPLKGLPAEAAPSAQSVDSAIINELNGSLPSRELVFEKDDDPSPSAVAKVATASTYVVNRNENGQAVVATISLTHVR